MSNTHTQTAAHISPWPDTHSELCDERSKNEGIKAPHSVAFVDFTNRTVLLSRVSALLSFPIATQVPPKDPKIYGCIRIPDDLFLQAAKTLLYDLTRSFFHIFLLFKTSSEELFLDDESALIECVSAPPTNDSQHTEVADEDASTFGWVPIAELCFMINEGFGWKHERDEKACLIFQKFILTPQLDGIKPWQKPGWHAQVYQTAISELRVIGFELTSPFVLLCISSRSVLMCATSTDGRLIYLKGSRPFEGAVTRFAAQYAPLIVSAPLYVNRDESWMLMEDAGTLNRSASNDEIKILIARYARLQIAAREHIQELIATGVPVKNADITTDSICEMLEDADVRAGLQKLGCEFMKQSKQQVRACLHKFMTMMFEERGLPLSLVHNDIYELNILRAHKNGDLVMLDWELATIDIVLEGLMDFQRIPMEKEESFSQFDEYFKVWSASANGSPIDIEGSLDYNARLLVSTKRSLENTILMYEYCKHENRKPTLEDEYLFKIMEALATIAEEMDKPQIFPSFDI